MMKVGTASSRMIPCSSRQLQLPAASSQLLATGYPGLCDISGDAVKAHDYCYYQVRQPGLVRALG